MKQPAVTHFFTASVIALLAVYYAEVVRLTVFPHGTAAVFALLCCGAGLAAGQRRGPKLLTLFVLGLGTLLHLSAGTRPAAALAGFDRMVSVIPLITLLPVAGLLFAFRAYGPALVAALARRIHTPRGLHAATWSVTHLISAVITMGALPVVYALMGREAKDDPEAQRFLATATLRGYTSSAFWTPNASAVAIGIDFTGARLAQVLPLGLLLTAVAAVVNLLSERGSGGALGARMGNAAPLTGVQRRLVNEFAVVLVLFLGLVIAIHEWTGIGLLALAPLIGLVLTVGGFLAFGAGGQLRSELADYLRRSLPPKSTEISLVLAIGYFTAGVQAAPLTRALLQQLQEGLAGQPGLVMLALPLMIIALGFGGITPTVAVLFVTGALSAGALGVAPAAIVGAICLGQVVGLAVTPVALPLFLLSSLTGAEVTTVGLRWNWRYAIGLFVAAQLVLQLWVRAG